MASAFIGAPGRPARAARRGRCVPDRRPPRRGERGAHARAQAPREPDRPEVVAGDREVGDPVWLRALLDGPARRLASASSSRREPRFAPRSAALWLIRSRASSSPCSARKRRATRPSIGPGERERVARDDTDDVLPDARRIAEPLQDSIGEARPAAAWLVLRVGRGLPEIVEQAGKPDSKRAPASAAFCTTRRCAPRAAAVASPSRASSRSRARTRESPAMSTPVSRARSSARAGLRPSRSFESSPMPVGLDPAADPLGRDVGEPGRACPHLGHGLGCEVEAELRRRTASARTRRSGSSVEARRADGADLSPLEVLNARRRGRPASPPSSRIAIALIVKSRRAMSSSSPIDASLTIAKSRWPGPVERSARGGVSSMPAGASARYGTIAREEPDADELPVHLHVLDLPVRLEERAQPCLVDARERESPRRSAAARAAGRGRRRRRRRRRSRASGRRSGSRSACRELAYRCATASISTRAPDGSFATSNVERAGGDRRRDGRTPRSWPRSRRDPGGRRSS